jgi:hypothetical protein
MAKKQNRSKDPDIISSEKALRSAARRALQIGLETGTAVWVIKRGQDGGSYSRISPQD